jgi:succinate dehydrogenase flavin-adding protein (antitoxin of CptAB toxin-antitoxin module)
MGTVISQDQKSKSLAQIISEQCDVKLYIKETTNTDSTTEKTYKATLQIFKKDADDKIAEYELSDEDITKLKDSGYAHNVVDSFTKLPDKNFFDQFINTPKQRQKEQEKNDAIFKVNINNETCTLEAANRKFIEIAKLNKQSVKFLKLKTIEIFNKNLIDKTLIQVKTDIDAAVTRKPEIHWAITAILVTTVMVGFIALTIGVGTILPNIILPHSAFLHFMITSEISSGSNVLQLGIQNLGKATPYLLGAGGTITATFFLLKILKKFKLFEKDNKILKTINNCLDEIQRIEDKYLVSGTTNAILNGVLLALLATMGLILFITTNPLHLHFLSNLTHLANIHPLSASTLSIINTIEGTLAYPTGVLLVISGITQLMQSIQDLYEAYKSNDSKRKKEAWLNIGYSATTIAAGLLTISALINSPLMYAINLVSFACAFKFAKDQLNKAKKRAAEAKLVKINDIKIDEYLDEKFKLTQDEINAKYKEIMDYNEKQIAAWIKGRIDSTTNKEKKQFLKIIANDNHEKIKFYIYVEEIYLSSIQKVLDFGSSLNPELVLKVLNSLGSDSQNEKQELLNEIQAKLKFRKKIEWYKTWGLYGPQIVIPFAMLIGGNKSIVGSKVASGVKFGYNSGMGLSSFGDAIVNVSPERRNISPPLEGKELNLTGEIIKAKTTA